MTITQILNPMEYIQQTPSTLSTPDLDSVKLQKIQEITDQSYIDDYMKLSTDHKHWLSSHLKKRKDLIYVLKKIRLDRKQLQDKISQTPIDSEEIQILKKKVHDISHEISEKQSCVDDYGLKHCAIFDERIKMVTKYQKYLDMIREPISVLRQIEHDIQQEELELYHDKLAERKKKYYKAFSYHKQLQKYHTEVESFIKKICPHEKHWMQESIRYGWTCKHCGERCGLLMS